MRRVTGWDGGDPGAAQRQAERAARRWATPGGSESDGFAEQQDGAAPGVGFCVEDEKAVDGTGPPIRHLSAGAFQREAVVFNAAQRGAQVGYHLLRPDDPDRAGGAAGIAG